MPRNFLKIQVGQPKQQCECTCKLLSLSQLGQFFSTWALKDSARKGENDIRTGCNFLNRRAISISVLRSSKQEKQTSMAQRKGHTGRGTGQSYLPRPPLGGLQRVSVMILGSGKTSLANEATGLRTLEPGASASSGEEGGAELGNIYVSLQFRI